MLGLGVILVLLGAGSLILPELGYQLRIMEPLQDAQPFAGIVLVVAGIAMTAVALMRKSKAAETVPNRAEEVVPPAG